MKQKQMILCWSLFTWIISAFLRFLNMSTGYDTEGLPITGHFSTYCLAGVSILILITYLLIAYRIRGRAFTSGITCSRKTAIFAYAGGALILSGTVADFLTTGSNIIIAMILLVLGSVSGLCLILTAYLRANGKGSNRIAELIPICYLLVKLIINFKGWSIDPIILDYCIRLFAMICILLSFYYITGFTFRIAKPVRSYFFTLAGAYFSVSAATEGIVGHSVADILFYLGCFLWLLPVIDELETACEKTQDSRS